MMKTPFDTPLMRATLAVACALTLFLLPLAFSTRAVAQGQTPAPPGPEGKVDRTRLEVIEELSESLANDLLGLSVA
ncbi:MAG: hypothetical protein LC802_17625, partial [Acidobacteria bacterium]|nr:hypothetical protein [Acidobacteriota bacterium]